MYQQLKACFRKKWFFTIFINTGKGSQMYLLEEYIQYLGVVQKTVVSHVSENQGSGNEGILWKASSDYLS